PCSACANISMLKLKFVVHHGKFSRQRLGSVEQLHGTDVIVAHRLLKNSVPSKEYLLVTDAVLDRLPTGIRDRFTPHTESFHHGGSVVTLRVVSTEPGRELTLYSDQPTDMYITTRIADKGGGRTSIMRSFLWDEPADAEVAEGLRQMMNGTVLAGEDAMREVF